MDIKSIIKSIDRAQAFIYSLIILLISATFLSHRSVLDITIGSAAFLSLILLSETPPEYSVSMLEKMLGILAIIVGFVILPFDILARLGIMPQQYSGMGFIEIGIACVGVLLVFYGFRGFKTYGVSVTFFFIYGLLTPMLTRARYAVDYHFPWYNAFIARVVGGLVWLGGINADVQSNIIILNGKNGIIALEVLPICAGVDAMVIFGLLLVLLIYHLRISNQTKIVSSLIGIFILIPLNLLRVTALVVIGYLYGLEITEFFHSHIGDVLFLLYVVGFFILLSRYEISPSEIEDIPQKDASIE